MSMGLGKVIEPRISLKAPDAKSGRHSEAWPRPFRLGADVHERKRDGETRKVSWQGCEISR